MKAYMQWIQLFWFFTYIAFGHVSGGRILNFYTRCKADAKEPWSYRGRNGPRYWGERYPTCDGDEQSPVAINTHYLVFDETLDQLIMNNYDVPITRGTIENDGHTILVNATDGVERSILVNDETYRLTQFHFHWGDAYYKGAEHTVDGAQYSMELHFVHQSSNNQIAVVGVFFQEQSGGNAELQNIIDHFPQVTYKDMRTQLKQELNLNNLLPSNPSSFYRYAGSLTTPNCAEGVTWSLLTRPLPVGLTQMDQFRKLYSATKKEATRKCKLSNNFRPVQPLNDRTVFISQ